MKISIHFADFWTHFNPEDNFIINTLRQKYEIELDRENPQYVFFSCFSNEYLKWFKRDAVMIFFSGENLAPDFNLYDYAIAFDPIDFQNRYLRLPLYVFYDAFKNLAQPKVIDSEQVLNRKFCSFIYSNAKYSNPARKDFYLELSKYKQIDAGGAMFNNVGGKVPDKLEFIKNYKFNIAFENSAVNGYTTEKIMEAMAANSLPIYWGNPLIGLDFNPKSFVNAADFASWSELAKYIEHLDKNDNVYLDILEQPWFIDTKYVHWQELLIEFFDNIIKNGKVLQPFGFRHSYTKRFKSKFSLLNLFKR